MKETEKMDIIISDKVQLRQARRRAEVSRKVEALSLLRKYLQRGEENVVFRWD